MNSYPHLIPALTAALVAFPWNESLRAHLEEVLDRANETGRPGLRLVEPIAEPVAADEAPALVAAGW